MDGTQLEEIAELIVTNFDPKRIILFGSHARGDQREDSDVDLFVEMESERQPPGRCYRAERDIWPAKMAS